MQLKGCLTAILLFINVCSASKIPSHYVFDTQLRSASENLGHALSTAASVFGSRTEASAKELNQGLQRIGLDTIKELAPKVEAFNAELRNAIESIDMTTAHFGNNLLVALDLFASALNDVNQEESGAVGKIANAVASVATSISSISKEMVKLSDNEVFQEISNKADKAALGLTNELYSIRVFIIFVIIIIFLFLLVFKMKSVMPFVFALVGLLLAVVLPGVTPECSVYRDPLLCALVILGALFGMGLGGILPKWICPLIVVIVAVSFGSLWHLTASQSAAQSLTEFSFPLGPGPPPCVYPGLLMTRNNVSAFKLNEDLLLRLATLEGPYSIVGVVGLYRTGKSTALTLYMREVMNRPNVTDACLSHFGVGHSHIGHTDGVWMWFMPFRLLGAPYRGRPGTLVLLDMEGMADPTKPNNGASRIFAFVSLMSSSLIVHLDKNLNLNDLGQLVAVSELAHYLGVEASNSPNSATQMLPELNFFLLSNQLYVDAPGMKDGTFLISQEIEKILDTPNKETAALKSLFPRRRGFAGAALGNGELAELQVIDRVPGIPHKPYSRSVVKVWKQIFANLEPKTFDGERMDGDILVLYIKQVMEIIANNGEIDVDDFYNHFLAIAKEQTLAILNKKMWTIESRLPLKDSEIDTEREALARLITQSVQSLQVKLSRISPSLIKGYDSYLNTIVEDHLTYLRKLNRLMATYEWVASPWDACVGVCPGHRHRAVVCMRADNKTAADFKCGNAQKPLEKESCHLEDYIWKTTPWATCHGTCPGERSRDVYCSRCDGRPVSDGLCKGMTSPGNKEACDLYSYSWVPGPWSQCHCGQSKTRIIACQRCDSLPVGQTMCATIPMPATSEFCGPCPPPHRSSCFSISTEVQNENGQAVPVQALRPGDWVLASGGQLTKVLFVEEASGGYDFLIFHLNNQQTLIVTPNHILFDGNSQPKRANQFMSGETLLHVNGTTAISSIAPVVEEKRIEIITQARTLVANGVIASCFDGNELWGHVYNFDIWILDAIGGTELMMHPWVMTFLSIDLGLGETALAWIEPGTYMEGPIVVAFVCFEKCFYVCYLFLLPGFLLWKLMKMLF